MTGCASENIENSTEISTTTYIEEYVYTAEFEDLNDEELLRYVEDSVYLEMTESLDLSDYYIENVDSTYISKEYLEELEYNSQSNIFFGYNLEYLESVMGDEKYVFTVNDDGETIISEYVDYDDTYDQIIKNVLIGTGVILVCVTISAVTSGAGMPAASLIFAASAKTGTVMALSSAAIGGTASGIITGLTTGDVEAAMKEAALSASEGFKWGAIIGSITGGITETVALHGATLNGLTMNEAAAIQKESGYPLDVIRELHSVEEYNVYKNAGLQPQLINGKLALVRSDIDLNLVDSLGRTNLARMQSGLAPIDSNGVSYELHHIGQETEGTLAILTQAEHDSAVLHGFKTVSEIDRNAFNITRTQFWKTMANILQGGL